MTAPYTGPITPESLEQRAKWLRQDDPRSSTAAILDRCAARIRELENRPVCDLASPEARAAALLGLLGEREKAAMRYGEATYAHNVLLRTRWNDFDALNKSDEEMRSALFALQQLAAARPAADTEEE